ncbi:MFS transporter [Anaerosporobacter sp.]|uniref:MFS transporter n=1 Tax=Anaerosporobacter sp. TaxID=1872529 RepID=UPI00286EBCB1|nr:MFS transporter [Anaerosporobacter sp.]
MKKLTTSKMFLFALGQFGWALLSGLISNWLVYFYQPDEGARSAGHTVFIPQGLVIFGIITIIGGITALGRVFDAITDPWIASLSDRCKSKNGRRIPFLKVAAIPLAVSTVLVFCAPIKENSWINAAWLLVFVLLYYLALTTYCTPYTALLPELGHSQEERINISTTISLTFIVGTAVAYTAPVVWGMFEGSMGRVAAMRLTFSIFAVIALIALFIPVFAIKEKDYVEAAPVEGTAFSSLVKTFRNKSFRIFVGSDILYWIALTMFQTGLPFFVTSLLGLSESMSTVYFVAMTALSLVFYIPINILAKKMGKKKLVLIAFAMFGVAYLYTTFFGAGLGISTTIQGYILVAIAAMPMAIFGILPQAMLADISESDAVMTGENREGMFYAARTFAFKMGQSLAMLIFTAVATIGTSGTGYRVAAGIACVFCVLGGIVLCFYNEKSVNAIIKGGK